jgi:FHS family L-fucose permease-like MFS transporter
MIGRFFGSVLLGTLSNKLKYKYSLYIVIFAFFVGWFIFSAGVKDGQFVFDSQPIYGIIFFSIAAINFLLMYLGKGIANVSLGIFGATNMFLVLAGFILPPQIGMWCLLSVGFFNSIMFPNIFSLAVNDLDPSEMPIASGIINTMIVGGAVVPVLMGVITDAADVRSALLIPILCFAYITFFALKGSKIR